VRVCRWEEVQGYAGGEDGGREGVD
jgi:hypothetical protein